MANDRHHKFWYGSEIETLRQLAAQGMSVEQIGARLGRTKDSILLKAHRCGITVSTRETLPADDTAELRAFIESFPRHIPYLTIERQARAKFDLADRKGFSRGFVREWAVRGVVRRRIR